MKFDKEMLKQLILIIVGVLAALFGYDVIQDDDELTISVPEAEEADEGEAGSKDGEATKSADEPTEEPTAEPEDGPEEE